MPSPVQSVRGTRSSTLPAPRSSCKDVDLQGPVSAAPDSAWMKRISGVLAKKARPLVPGGGRLPPGPASLRARAPN
jgi:hypothetical protein